MKVLNVTTINCRGQTRFNVSKQLQVQDFIVNHRIDIALLQETNFNTETFDKCDNIKNNFSYVYNNSNNEFGTAVIVRNTFEINNIKIDTEGRIITCEVGGITFANVYAPSGSDGDSRSHREGIFGDSLPNILINRKDNGIIGGDWNSIILKSDCTKNPEAKISPCFRRLASVLELCDSHRSVHPRSNDFSRYYVNDRFGSGATRIDRLYSYGNINPIKSSYIPIPWSDHYAQVVSYTLPDIISKKLSPRSKPIYKISPNVIDDELFQEQLKEAVLHWSELRDYHHYSLLQWWDLLVKPGIRKLAINRSREINKSR